MTLARSAVNIASHTLSNDQPYAARLAFARRLVLLFEREELVSHSRDILTEALKDSNELSM